MCGESRSGEEGYGSVTIEEHMCVAIGDCKRAVIRSLTSAPKPAKLPLVSLVLAKGRHSPFEILWLFQLTLAVGLGLL